jgi:hypothetical protein
MSWAIFEFVPTVSTKSLRRVKHNGAATDSAGLVAIGQLGIHNQHGQYFAQSPQSFAEYAVAGIGKSLSFSTARLATVLPDSLRGFSA